MVDAGNGPVPWVDRGVGTCSRRIDCEPHTRLKTLNLKLFYRQKQDVRITCYPDTYAGLGMFSKTRIFAVLVTFAPFIEDALIPFRRSTCVDSSKIVSSGAGLVSTATSRRNDRQQPLCSRKRAHPPISSSGPAEPMSHTGTTSLVGARLRVGYRPDTVAVINERRQARISCRRIKYVLNRAGKGEQGDEGVSGGR